jgi:uncharacterized protein
MVSSNPFASLFGRSPFKPLQQHMRSVKKCAAQVTKLFEALCEGDRVRVVEIKEKIFELEHEADEIKNQMRAHLPKSLLMPVDRRDLLEVLDIQDSIADTAQDIAGILVDRPMEVPESMRDPLMIMTRRCVDAADHAARIIGRLDELVETGFRGPESEAVSEMIDELSKIETDTDRMESELTRRLFAHEDDMNPVSVIFWYDLIKMISELADLAEKVGNRLRLLLAR